MESGKCPFCGQMTLQNQKEPVLDGGSIIFDWRCETCGATGSEVYNLEFVEHTNLHQ